MSFVVQIDRYEHAACVISVARGLWILVPTRSAAPYRRAAETTELEALCGKCGQKLCSWPFAPSRPENPAATYLACECLTVAFEERFELDDIVAHWKSFRRLANRILARVGPVGTS
jgi:hypothetical protein